MFIAKIKSGRGSISFISVILIAAAALVGCGNTKTVENQIGSQPSLIIPTNVEPTASSTVTPFWPVAPSVTSSVTPTATPTVRPTARLFVPKSLVNPRLSLHAGPVDLAIELQIPSLKINAPVVGVGLNSNNVMDAPTSYSAKDPIWQEVFWYRGGGIPGDVGTATIAGHVDDYLGRQAVFAHLKNLHKGDLIIIHDTRNDHEVRFKVTGLETYTAKQAVDPVILEQIYGSGPVNGEGPQPSDDGLSHLTLITCDGWFINGAFNRHLVVYAIRSG